ncbi:hypothetical protein MYX04_10845 [Nitrospiraceae bacterium AH_259_D15_M11_P09]|nr:hypothetical protein [Nitrospiraceae bacterium AH_259_D15_M11_P09]
MADHADLTKLRRFALVMGLLLFLYAFGLVELAEPDEPLTLNLSNLPQFEISPKVIGWGLIIVSVYAMLRYWYYAIGANVSPMYERRLIREGQMPPSLSEKAAETVRLQMTANQLSFPYETRQLDQINNIVKAVSECAWKLNNDVALVLRRLFPGLAVLEVKEDKDAFGLLVPYDLQHQKLLPTTLSAHTAGDPINLTLRIRGLLLPKRKHPIILWHDLDYTLPLWVNGIAILAFITSLFLSR